MYAKQNSYVEYKTFLKLKRGLLCLGVRNEACSLEIQLHITKSSGIDIDYLMVFRLNNYISLLYYIKLVQLMTMSSFMFHFLSFLHFLFCVTI